MPGKPGYPRIRRRSLIPLFVAMLLAVVIACGGSEESSGAVAADPPTPPPAPASTSAPAVSPTKTPRPVAEPVIPAVEPEPGSDEAAIFEVLAVATMAMRSEDYALYRSACNPAKKTLTLEQVEFVFDSVFSQYGDLAGYNQRDVTVRIFKDDTALTESIFYEFDNVLFSSFQYSFIKVDGEWYVDSFC